MIKPIHLLILAVVVVAGFLFFKSQQPNAAAPTAAPSGGSQNVTARDPFAATANAINAVFAAIGAIAQTAPKSN